MKELVVIADIHLALIWDKISKLEPGFFNPNRTFASMLKELGSDQELVINGDIIDYFYSGHRKEQGNNWNLFLKIIQNFRGEVLLNVGNHDYRRYPYNLNVCNFKNTRWTKKRLKELYNAVDFGKFRWIGELKALITNSSEYDPRAVGFKDFYAKNFNDDELIFLNTGEDALNHLPIFFKTFHWWPLLNILNPASRGLTDEQIAFLGEKIAANIDEEKIIFLHCPPFFYKNTVPVILEKRSYLRDNRRMSSYGTTFFSNNWEFIETIINSPSNIIVITSHIHIDSQYIIDKETRILRRTNLEEINKLRTDRKYIKFTATLPLSIIRPKKEKQKIGYLIINNKHIAYKEIKE
jgi:hypothetical protein